MTSKIISVDPKESKRLEGLIGGYNDFPPNMRDIPENRFWSEFMLWAWPYNDSRQAYDKSVENWWNTANTTLRLWFDSQGEGIGFVSEIVKAERVRPTKFFRFSPCLHTYETVIKRKCYSKSRCTKCGKVLEIDSSD